MSRVEAIVSLCVVAIAIAVNCFPLVPELNEPKRVGLPAASWSVVVVSLLRDCTAYESTQWAAGTQIRGALFVSDLSSQHSASISAQSLRIVVQWALFFRWS